MMTFLVDFNLDGYALLLLGILTKLGWLERLNSYRSDLSLLGKLDYRWTLAIVWFGVMLKKIK